MRAGRLLSILLTLSARGRMSAGELATELEVSVRTVYRDIEALSSAGVPVYATRGRGGGVALLDGYRTRLTGMTADEADALFLTSLPGAAADLGLGGVVAATQVKLLAALPPDLRERATSVRDRFHVDAPGWLRENDESPYLAVIAEAVWTHRLLDVRYERVQSGSGRIDDRVLAPLGLVLKAGVWYLVADRPDDEKGPRTYRVARVQAAAVREQTFARPDGFDLADFWTTYQRGYTERVFRATATVRIDEAGRELLFLLGTHPARAARRALAAPDPDGWATTTVPIESVRHAQHALLQLGEHIEVLGPPELRDAVAASARALAARYRVSSSRTRPSS